MKECAIRKGCPFSARNPSATAARALDFAHAAAGDEVQSMGLDGDVFVIENFLEAVLNGAGITQIDDRDASLPCRHGLTEVSHQPPPRLGSKPRLLVP